MSNNTSFRNPGINKNIKQIIKTKQTHIYLQLQNYRFTLQYNNCGISEVGIIHSMCIVWWSLVEYTLPIPISTNKNIDESGSIYLLEEFYLIKTALRRVHRYYHFTPQQT